MIGNAPNASTLFMRKIEAFESPIIAWTLSLHSNEAKRPGILYSEDRHI